MTKLGTLLERIDSFLNRIEGALLISFLAVMVVLAFVQVVLRNLFSEGILWADILLRHMVLWVGFLGAAIATSKERHITIDALTRFFRGRSKSVVKVITGLFATFICYRLAIASVDFVSVEMDLESTVYASIPTWYAQLIIPVGYVLLAFHFAIRTALAAPGMMKKDQS
jgi:TRAP-type C4-dicarboxylate transport system permease small subunit